jgi:AcrR family transcriptional regulator
MKETEERLIAAATAVVGRRGIAGATTREIARQAGVNEVTLFRHFHSKDELLRRLVLQWCTRHRPVGPTAPARTPAAFRRGLRAFALGYVRLIREHEEFVRTFMGEIGRRPTLARKLFGEGGSPTREKLITYLRDAQRHGLLRKGLNPMILADALTGMLLAGVLRRPLTEEIYPESSYVGACLDIFLKGVQT